MARYCENCLGAICDFCKWYDSNNDEDGCYTGNGFCRRWQVAADPEDSCGEFICHCLHDGDPYWEQPWRYGQTRPDPPSGTWIKTTPPDPPCPVPGAPS